MPKDSTQFNQDDTIQKLYKRESLLDILLDIESMFEQYDLYAYENWFDGEIVEGPILKRHWITCILKFPRSKMPEPQGALRLIKHGMKVQFEKSSEKELVDVHNSEDLDPKSMAPKTKNVGIWLVHIQIPRRFIDDLDDGSIDADENGLEEIDVDAASDVELSGMDDTSLKDDEISDEFEDEASEEEI